MSSVIYLIGNKDDLSLPIKIGRTTEKNLQRRRASIQTGCPWKLSVLGVFPGDSQTEIAIHKICDKWNAHINGEWFQLTPEQINYLLDPERFWSYSYYKKCCECDCHDD